tara:strand:+ start:4050 stop:5387 length:1338 start_codon:yes stop_codon:yes gene_type:complete
VLRYIFLSTLLFSIQANSDIFLSSPKIKLNSQDQRIIELKIENANVSDSDIVLYEYKTNNLLDKNNISYTLIQNFEDYQVFAITLSDDYEEDYFSFKVNIKDKYIKDIFIFLPSKIRNSYRENNNNSYSNNITKPSIVNEKKSSAEVSLEQSSVEEDLSNKDEGQEQIIQGSEITTVWSMAKAIKGNNDDVSIYQVMWSLYLGNKEAFINENINLVRKDIDIIVPSISDISDVSYQIAKDSIVKMNESFTNNFSNSAKSLLVLTAPKTIENNNDIEPNISLDKPKNISFDQPSNPKDIIEQNTKQLSLEVDNETLDDLVETNNNEDLSNEVNSGFDLFDLLFIALISLASGILLALIFIYLRNIKNSKSIQYDFEEASDDDSNFSPMPSGLSIENDENQQKLDLAITYIEMKDFENATKLLKDILNNCNDEDMKITAKNLLDKIN